MKLFRYRRPSLKTVLGITPAKRQLRRSFGISQVEAITKQSRIRQRINYHLGLYSPTVRFFRNTLKGRLPSFLGMFSRKRA